MIAAGLWWLSTWPEAWRWWRDTRKVAFAQRRLLGRHPDDFRERHPLTTYADYQDYVPPDTLLFEPTSGTLQSKLIPYTPRLQQEFRRGLAPWICNLFAHFPGVLRGKHYWSISPPASRDRTWRGKPVGFLEEGEYLGGWTRRLAASLMAVPKSVMAEPDYVQATRTYLQRCRDLTLVSVWSPTFWMNLAPENLWPRLQVISCWGDGYSERFLQPLRRAYPGVYIQKKGLIATEAFCTFPLVGRQGCALAIRSHFFEFLDDGQRSFLAHELSRGATYRIVVTTGNGFRRYVLGDRVRVEGFLNECPLLSFQGRDGVVDRFGEKLSEAQLQLPRSGFAMVAWEKDAYCLFAEEDAAAHARRLEAHLRKINFHYDCCRTLGQIGAMRAFQLEDGALPAYMKRLQEAGTRPGDIKVLPLRSDEGWSGHLPGRFLTG